MSDATPKTSVIFIVHGHDEVNRFKLKDLLKDRFELAPVNLSYQPGKGRTLIQKFEEEAEQARFAFVLLTPDDIIRNDKGEYSQARPNVIFEL